MDDGESDDCELMSEPMVIHERYVSSSVPNPKGSTVSFGIADEQPSYNNKYNSAHRRKPKQASSNKGRPATSVEHNRNKIKQLNLTFEDRQVAFYRLQNNGLKPHGGNTATNRHPPDINSHDKAPPHNEEIRSALHQTTGDVYASQHTPAYATHLRNQVMHSGESPLFAYELLPPTKEEQQYTGNEMFFYKRVRSGQGRAKTAVARHNSLPPQRRGGDYYRPNGAHQYLTDVELRDFAAKTVNLTHGKPTRAQLLRQRHKFREPQSDRSEVKKELRIRMDRVREAGRPESARAPNARERMMDAVPMGERPHSFLLGARYNRAHCLDANVFHQYGVYLPRAGTCPAFVVNSRTEDKLYSGSGRPPSSQEHLDDMSDVNPLQVWTIHQFPKREPVTKTYTIRPQTAKPAPKSARGAQTKSRPLSAKEWRQYRDSFYDTEEPQHVHKHVDELGDKLTMTGVRMAVSTSQRRVQEAAEALERSRLQEEDSTVSYSTPRRAKSAFMVTGRSLSSLHSSVSPIVDTLQANLLAQYDKQFEEEQPKRSTPPKETPSKSANASNRSSRAATSAGSERKTGTGGPTSVGGISDIQWGDVQEAELQKEEPCATEVQPDATYSQSSENKEAAAVAKNENRESGCDKVEEADEERRESELTVIVPRADDMEDDEGKSEIVTKLSSESVYVDSGEVVKTDNRVTKEEVDGGDETKVKDEGEGVLEQKDDQGGELKDEATVAEPEKEEEIADKVEKEGVEGGEKTRIESQKESETDELHNKKEEEVKQE